MKLYRGKIPGIARQIVETLRRAGDIEIEADLVSEVIADVEAIMNEYLRMEREIIEAAKDVIERRGLDHTSFGRVKKAIAKEKGFVFGDDALDYLLNQVTEILLYSNNVEEVFSEDPELRSKMVPIFRRYLEVEDELDMEVRRRIRNLEEGTESWDIEYNRILRQLKRQKGFE